MKHLLLAASLCTSGASAQDGPSQADELAKLKADVADAHAAFAQA